MRTQWIDLFLLLLTALTSGTFLLDVPGFHFDEVWISQLAAKIAFDPGFWPLFGMNSYTIPVLSYLQALVFRIAGYPSMELARALYWILNLTSFVLFYQWIKKTQLRAAWIFALLWATLPLSVFNQRLCLEVTTGYAFFAGLALQGITRGCFEKKSRIWFIIALLAIWVGTASHVLFICWTWAALWACIKETPETLENHSIQWLVTLVFTPMTFLVFMIFAHPEIGNGEKLKSILVAIGSCTILVMTWAHAWKKPWVTKCVQLASWMMFFLSSISLLFFFLFEISGAWPTSQSTGKVNYLALFPGALIIIILGISIYSAYSKSILIRFLTSFWSAICVCIMLSVYKPTSARYWELALLSFLLLGSLALIELPRKQKLFYHLICFASILNLGALTLNYFMQTLQWGASSYPYRWLWVNDNALYYRPIIAVYQTLLTTYELCQQDHIQIDEGRTHEVLQIYRAFAQQQGREKTCSTNHSPVTYWIGRDAWAKSQISTKFLIQSEHWGDLVVYRTL